LPSPARQVGISVSLWSTSTSRPARLFRPPPELAPRTKLAFAVLACSGQSAEASEFFYSNHLFGSHVDTLKLAGNYCKRFIVWIRCRFSIHPFRWETHKLFKQSEAEDWIVFVLKGPHARNFATNEHSIGVSPGTKIRLSRWPRRGICASLTLRLPGSGTQHYSACWLPRWAPCFKTWETKRTGWCSTLQSEP